MRLPQVDILIYQVNIIVYELPSELWECGCCIKRVQFDPDCQPGFPQITAAVSPTVGSVPVPADALLIYNGDCSVTMG